MPFVSTQKRAEGIGLVMLRDLINHNRVRLGHLTLHPGQPVHPIHFISDNFFLNSKTDVFTKMQNHIVLVFEKQTRIVTHDFEIELGKCYDSYLMSDQMREHPPIFRGESRMYVIGYLGGLQIAVPNHQTGNIEWKPPRDSHIREFTLSLNSDFLYVPISGHEKFWGFAIHGDTRV